MRKLWVVLLFLLRAGGGSVHDPFADVAAFMRCVDVGDDIPALRTAAALQDDASQLRSGTVFERTSLDALDHLRQGVLNRLPGDHSWSLDEEDQARHDLVEISARHVLGRCDEESACELVLWDEAQCSLEGVGSPYRAAAQAAALAYFDAPDRWGLLDPLADLHRRYEDEPLARDQIADDIRARLRQFVEAAPFPV